MDTTRYTDSRWYDSRIRGDDDDDATTTTTTTAINAAVSSQEDNNNNNDNKDDDDQDSSFLLPDLYGNSDILTPMHIRELSNFMPARAEGYAWTLAFTTTTMGFSLKSLYRSLSRYEGPVLLIIRDNQDVVFGAFSSCSLNPSESFYGTGETYLFTFQKPQLLSSKSSEPNTNITQVVPESSAGGSSSSSSNSYYSSASTISKSNQNITLSNKNITNNSNNSNNSNIRVDTVNNNNNSKNMKHKFARFPWTGDNLYFIKGNSDSLAFGAGEGNFGLWLDEDLYHGSTHKCKTFNNDQLTYQEDFVVCTLECWVFL